MKKTILFDHHDLIAKDSKQTLSPLLNTNSQKVPEILRGFKYPISSWPVILPKKDTEKLIRYCYLIPKLIQQIPELYFENNLKKIADFYFGKDETLAQFAMICSGKKVDVSCRLDLIKATDGFKVLEVNAGSSIGGMEFQNFEPLISEIHTELLSEELGIVATPTQEIYIDFIIQKAISYLSEDEDQINIYMVELIANDDDLAKYKQAENFYNEILNNQIGKYKKKGSVIINKLSEVKFINNTLTFNDKRIHVVLFPNFALKDVSPDIFRAFVMDKIYFPDHLSVSMIRDKRNLALLRELATKGKFLPVENQEIIECIPWSVLIDQAEVTYDNKQYDLQVLLKEKKDNFVIKIADGLQGNDVFVGKYMSNDAWSDAIKKALDEKKYIVQEFISSEDLLAVNKNNTWVPHSLVWGAFGFGATYGGVWVRMTALENSTGVINSATGAVEAIVYEETEVQNK